MKIFILMFLNISLQWSGNRILDGGPTGEKQEVNTTAQQSIQQDNGAVQNVQNETAVQNVQNNTAFQQASNNTAFQQANQQLSTQHPKTQTTISQTTLMHPGFSSFFNPAAYHQNFNPHLASVMNSNPMSYLRYGHGAGVYGNMMMNPMMNPMMMNPYFMGMGLMGMGQSMHGGMGMMMPGMSMYPFMNPYMGHMGPYGPNSPYNDGSDI